MMQKGVAEGCRRQVLPKGKNFIVENRGQNVSWKSVSETRCPNPLPKSVTETCRAKAFLVPPTGNTQLVTKVTSVSCRALWCGMVCVFWGVWGVQCGVLQTVS